MIYNLSSEHTIANKYLAQLRDHKIQKDSLRFRRNMERLGEVFAYEISKQLTYAPKEIETPLGSTTIHLPIQRIVLGTILRAGLPMHHGLLNVFDDADNAFVSAFRKHHKDGSFEINLEYISCPELDDSVLILTDPMLATGASMVLALQSLLENGTPASIHVVTAIASSDGISYLERTFPDINLWIGAKDEELTAKSYIVPGLGDAGDLSFGIKLQD